jgi:hypothetical protein
MTDAEWEERIEKLLEELHRLRQQGLKADVLVKMGRRDEETDEVLPPDIQTNVRLT